MQSRAVTPLAARRAPRAAAPAILSFAALLLTACDQSAPPEPLLTDPVASETAVPASLPSAEASGEGGGIASPLDSAALQEKRDPDRLLRYYASAVRVGDWAAAAKAWSLDARMTPEKLEAEFGGDVGPQIALGKGDTEGAAGSLYYEAPVVITFPDGRTTRRGTIVLRRANDVPGASAEQLVWRIERSSTVSQ